MAWQSAVCSIKRMEPSLQSGAVSSKSATPTHLNWLSQKMQMFLHATLVSASRYKYPVYRSLWWYASFLFWRMSFICHAAWHCAYHRAGDFVWWRSWPETLPVCHWEGGWVSAHRARKIKTGWQRAGQGFWQGDQGWGSEWLPLSKCNYARLPQYHSS